MKMLLIPLFSVLSLVLGTINNDALADQRDERLPQLFESLLFVHPGANSILIENKIWSIWLENKDEQITLLMNSGSEATQSGDIDAALTLYTKVIRRNPNYAEGWNQRALTHYLMGNYESSLSDIRKTLTLEPRHFGAISGQGLIYSAQNNWALAKKAFEKALDIHPTMKGPRVNLQINKNPRRKRTGYSLCQNLK